MEFLVVGLNHRTAPVEVRELLSLNKEQLPDALTAMNGHGVGGVILSTCNRSEFSTLDVPEDGADRVNDSWLSGFASPSWTLTGISTSTGAMSASIICSGCPPASIP